MKPLVQLLLGFALLGLISGCLVETPVRTPEPSVAPSEQLGATATQPVESPATSLPEVPEVSPLPALPTATPNPQLNDKGPWLVFNTTEGLMAANPDGSGLQQLRIHIPNPSADLNRYASHGAAWLAFFMGSPGDFPPKDLILGVKHLPDGFILPFAPMFSQDIQAKINPPDRPPEAVVAVTDSQIMQWSPDGSQLAFIAAIDGPTSDLYLFTPDGEKLDRLTDGPTEAATPIWSPDGKWIVHQGVNTFGTGAGWDVSAVWAAAADGSEVKKLYDAPGSGGEVFMGWADEETFAVQTWTGLGPKNLRLVNLQSGEITRIYEAGFGSAAFDETNATFAFTGSNPDTSLTPGVYLLNGSGVPRLVEAGNWVSVEWSKETGAFFAKSPEGLISFSSEGSPVTFPGERWAIASPDGGRVAVWGNAQFGDIPGVRLYYVDGSSAQIISTASAKRVVWRPDGAGLFYVEAETLYYVDVPGGTPRQVAQGVDAGLDWGLGWVW